MIHRIVKNLKQKCWSEKDPREKYQMMLDFMDKLLNIVGCHILTDNRLYWLSFSPFVVCIVYWSFTFYTVHYHIQRQALSKLLPCLCMLGVSISSFLSYLGCIMRRSGALMKNATVGINNLIYNDPKCMSTYYGHCSREITKTWKNYIIDLLVLYSSTGCAMVGPMYVYIKYNQRTTLFQLRLPYVDEESMMEFTLNGIMQAIAGFIAIIGNFGIEGNNMLFINSLNITSQISKTQYTDFSGKLRMNRMSNVEMRIRLIQMFKQNQVIDTFMKNTSQAMYWRNFLAPIIFTYTIGISVYCQYALNFPAGYGIAFMSYVQLCTMCIVGAAYVKRNNEMNDAVYGFAWYYLPNELQRDIATLTVSLQYGTVATVGPLGNMDFETAFSLSKRIYSFFMYLVNFNR